MQRKSSDYIQNDEKWQHALASKNPEAIKTLIIKEKIIPADLNEQIIVEDWQHNTVSSNIIDILLQGNNLGQDAISFEAADQLLKLGATLPQPSKQLSDFEKVSDYFKHLSHHDADLYLTLRNHPAIICEQDENGQTILHHAAKIGVIMGSNSASLIHTLLFNAPEINFNLKDKDGNTPVHIAAQYCKDRVTCQYIFPNYVNHAVKVGFDFSTLNAQGQSILHIATRLSHMDARGFLGRINNVKNLLTIVPDIDVNVLSSSGSTAFYYAINWLYFAEANTLLKAGANPFLCGNSDRDPMKMIDQYIKDVTLAIAQKDTVEAMQHLNYLLEQLNALKTKIVSKGLENPLPHNPRLSFWSTTSSSSQRDMTVDENDKSFSPGYGS